MLRFVKTLQETLFPNAAPQVLPLGQFGGLSFDDQATSFDSNLGGSIHAAIGWLQLSLMPRPFTSLSFISSCRRFDKAKKELALTDIASDLHPRKTGVPWGSRGDPGIG